MNRQIFIVILGALFILFVTVIGAYTTNIVSKVTYILQAPAATTKITVEKLVFSTNSANLTLYGFESEINSKLLDLIILAAGN